VPDPFLRWVFWFIVGSLWGSFLNVCIYRLPREQSIVRPRSHCPSCQHLIAWRENLPLLSYIGLRGRCAHCGGRISWRYPIVELITGVATVGVVSRFGAWPIGWVYVAFVAALIAASFIDLEFQIIPDEISLGGLAAGLLVSALIPSLHGTDSHLASFGRSVVGMVVGGGVLYGTGVVGDFIFRKESMGGGDIKLLAMAGSVLGWKLVLLTFFIAPIFALIPGLAVLVLKRSHIIPYGPFLSIGLVVALFAGDDLLRLTGMEETIRLIWYYYRPW